MQFQNLEIKKLIGEKKEALAAQFSAEATLRRVYVTQKGDELVPVEVHKSSLESEIRQYKNEVQDAMLWMPLQVLIAESMNFYLHLLHHHADCDASRG